MHSRIIREQKKLFAMFLLLACLCHSPSWAAEPVGAGLFHRIKYSITNAGSFGTAPGEMVVVDVPSLPAFIDSYALISQFASQDILSQDSATFIFEFKIRAD